eukprot:6005578-Prymnesium_polylepis.1
MLRVPRTATRFTLVPCTHSSSSGPLQLRLTVGVRRPAAPPVLTAERGAPPPRAIAAVPAAIRCAPCAPVDATSSAPRGAPSKTGRKAPAKAGGTSAPAAASRKAAPGGAAKPVAVACDMAAAKKAVGGLGSLYAGLE